jgi:hypothetical protein
LARISIPWRARTLQNHFIAGAQDTISYLLFGLAVEHYPPDAATDAQAIWLKRRQATDGHWPIQTIRPPIESNDIEVTAISLRALQAFAPPAQRAEYTRAVERAAQWLDDREGDRDGGAGVSSARDCRGPTRRRTSFEPLRASCWPRSAPMAAGRSSTSDS